MKEKTNGTRKEGKTLRMMIQLYCRENHDGKRHALCADCDSLASYALKKIERCAWGKDKPACAQCHIHCYEKEMRQKIILIMRYAGPRMIYRHPLLALGHLFVKISHGKTSPKKLARFRAVSTPAPSEADIPAFLP